MNRIKHISSSLALIFFISCSNEPKSNMLLPVYGEKKVKDGDTLYHTISTFTLINQTKDTVSDKTIQNKIYVADFFFATCQSICPQMTSQLTRVQETFKFDNDFLILSHTVNPKHDTAEVLYAYAGKYNAIGSKWHFLTGNKQVIYDLAKFDYLVNALEDDGTAEGFLHSELLLLVDKQKRIRGMYDGTDSIQVNKLIADIKLLKTEN